MNRMCHLGEDIRDVGAGFWWFGDAGEWKPGLVDFWEADKVFDYMMYWIYGLAEKRTQGLVKWVRVV